MRTISAICDDADGATGEVGDDRDGVDDFRVRDDSVLRMSSLKDVLLVDTLRSEDLAPLVGRCHTYRESEGARRPGGGFFVAGGDDPADFGGGGTFAARDSLGLPGGGGGTLLA